jgi:hypothetical protein
VFFGLIPLSHEFEFTDVLRTSAFGVSIGGLTGLMFGFMDSMKAVQETASLKTLSNSAKGSYIFKSCTHSSVIFGAFFTGFHMTKYTTRLIFSSSDEFQIFTASLASLGALGYKQQNRRLLPYACMLIGMDTFNLLWRDDSSVKGLRPDGTRVGEVRVKEEEEGVR